MTRWLAVLSVAAMVGVLGGCVSLASYPAAPGETAVKNPNDPRMIDVMVLALDWVIRRYPPETTGDARLAINLPVGVRERIYERAAIRVGLGAVPLSTQTQNLPTYHVARLRIRGDEAAVDILRPVTEVGEAPGGGAVYQEIRVNMRGGVRPWHVVSHREWTPGTISRMPDLHFIDAPPSAAAAAPDAGS